MVADAGGADTDMLVYDYFRSSASYRLRITLALKGLNPERQFVHLRRSGGEQKLAAYLAVNPQGLVPALRTDRGVLSQSLAIIDYLDELHPDPPLLPLGAWERAQARSIAATIACDIHPLSNLRVLEHLGLEFGADAERQRRWCRHWIQVGLDALEQQVSRVASEGFAVGDRPSIADICIVPQLHGARRHGVDMTVYPRLAGIEQACNEVTAFITAAPREQPDFEP